MLHFAILLTGNREDAEDAVQDAMISVAAKWPRPQTTAYLRRAVANRAIDLDDESAWVQVEGTEPSGGYDYCG